MKKIFKWVLYSILIMFVFIFALALVLAFYPVKSKLKHYGITPEEAVQLRQNYSEAHGEFVTSDGETLFLRRWNPDSVEQAKKDIAILVFPGLTAHSGAYKMAGVPISAGGYITFGLDYRGHGLSDGNRGDSPGKERWIADLSESVRYVKSLGFKKVIILGHSLGVAAGICVADAIQDEISGLVLLSGAYEGKKTTNKSASLFQKARVLACSVFRPSFQVVEGSGDNNPFINDRLFNFRYTIRYLTMLNVKELRLPASLNIPVLVGIGDKDEVFSVEKVKEFYDAIPGTSKEFLVMKNTAHAEIPVESWNEIVVWLDKNLNKF